MSSFSGHPIFLHLNLQSKIPPKRQMQFQWPPPSPPSSETRSEDTWTQLLVTNFLRIIKDLQIPTSKISHCLLQCQIYSHKIFTSDQPAIMNSTQPHTPLPKNILCFQQLWEDPRRLCPSLRSHKKILNPPYLFVPLINITNEKWNFGLTLHHPSLNKTRNTKDATSAGPNQSFMLHTNTTYPPTIKALPTTKTKLGLLSFPLCFLTEGSPYHNWKANSYSPLPGNNVGPLDLKCYLIAIRSLTFHLMWIT